MIYLAESGSTKTDGVFLNDDGSEVTRVKTMGFNPYFHSSELITKEMQKLPEVQQYAPEVKQVFFYGAGCSAPHLNKIVEKGLQGCFPHAEVKVDHDLLASAYASYSGEPAITCILGTGSNSVYFDGKEIYEEVPSLAFILGDEGSASYIGKKLISSYFYKQMPREAAAEFEKKYQLSKDEVIDRVYRQPNPNVYLAGFAPFAHAHIKHPFFWETVFSGFKLFLEIHVLCYEQARQVPVHFVGSIAHHFSDILENAMEHLDLRTGNIIQKPVDQLIEYHRKHIFSSQNN